MPFCHFSHILFLAVKKSKTENQRPWGLNPQHPCKGRAPCSFRRKAAFCGNPQSFHSSRMEMQLAVKFRSKRSARRLLLSVHWVKPFSNKYRKEVRSPEAALRSKVPARLAKVWRQSLLGFKGARGKAPQSFFLNPFQPLLFPFRSVQGRKSAFPP